ncbi:MAG: hypothetical protein D3913_04655 [Candidatus Electrothrix sp. LOE1_4_5]|nr:hypothetical protein [Candidatus Electrothrix gigas]
MGIFFEWIEKTISSIKNIPRTVLWGLAGIFVGVLAFVLITQKIIEIKGLKITPCCGDSRCIELEDALKEAANDLIRERFKLADAEHREGECKIALTYYRDAHTITNKYRKILPDRNFGNEKIFNKASSLDKESTREEACNSYDEAFNGFL